MAQKKSPIRRGADNLTKKESSFLQLKADEAIDIVPLQPISEMISVDQHAIWLDAGNSPIFVCLYGTGEKCPGCQLDDKAKFRGFMNVWNKDQGVRLFAFGIKLARSLAEADEALDGGLQGQVLRIKKEGSGLKTTYTLTPTGRKSKEVIGMEAIDIEQHLGPLTRDGILAALANAEIDITGIATAAELKALELDEEPEAVTAPTAPAEETVEDEWADVN